MCEDNNICAVECFLLRIEIREEEQDGRTSGIQRLDLILCVWLDCDV